MTQFKAELAKSGALTENSAEADRISERSESVSADELVTETLKQTFPASDPPSWWAGRSSKLDKTQSALSRR